eukprot:6189903-Pleurochrysis_carterae.AAC.8
MAMRWLACWLGSCCVDVDGYAGMLARNNTSSGSGQHFFGKSTYGWVQLLKHRDFVVADHISGACRRRCAMVSGPRILSQAEKTVRVSEAMPRVRTVGRTYGARVRVCACVRASALVREWASGRAGAKALMFDNYRPPRSLTTDNS